ncbi:Ribonuclease_3 domain-containing protein [Arachis hypogaea]|nr:Ribonuclease_3 domain-containing protein [Arachis hypogaea]
MMITPRSSSTLCCTLRFSTRGSRGPCEARERYPREGPGPTRERVFGLIGKSMMPRWIKEASLHNLVFPFDDMDKLVRKEREPPVKSVFWALLGQSICASVCRKYTVFFLKSLEWIQMLTIASPNCVDNSKM